MNAIVRAQLEEAELRVEQAESRAAALAAAAAGESPPWSPLDLAPIKARLEAAKDDRATGSKLALMARAADDIAALVAEVERLRLELDAK